MLIVVLLLPEFKTKNVVALVRLALEVSVITIFKVGYTLALLHTKFVPELLAQESQVFVPSKLQVVVKPET